MAEVKEELLALRERWADLQNAHLEKNGHNERVDHRSLKDQGIDREPEKHLGGSGVRSLNAHDISAILERRAAEGELERSQNAVSIIDLSGDIKRAKDERGQVDQKAKEEAARAFAAQTMEKFKKEQAAREFAAQTMEKFKAEQERKAQQEKQAQQSKEPEQKNQDKGYDR